MNWLSRFFYGRYGVDLLSIVLLVLSMVLTFTASITSLYILTLISYIPLGISIYRSLSRDTAKRYAENQKFTAALGRIRGWFQKTQAKIKDRRVNVYFTCSVCKTKLRVPRGKGKIKVTCPKCKSQFIGKT